MLKKHLIVKTNPITNKDNVIFWNNYRITVLKDRLFRIEQNDQKIFRDSATQSVWFRDLGKVDFSFSSNEDELLVITKACKLKIRPSRKDCRIEINGVEKKISNEGNLKGTYRTLDCCDGDMFCEYALKDRAKKITISNGVCSKTGVALFDDAKSLSLSEKGEIIAEKGLGTDEYVFAYGNDYRGAVKALYEICGSVPMVPRYSLGNWWSRYYRYTDKEYLTLLNRFSERDIPLTVATIDMDWHYSDFVKEEKGITEENEDKTAFNGNNGWTGYSWNVNLFPDYKAFLKKIEDMNLKITLNIHPADGVRWWDDMYEEMAIAMGIDPKTKQKVNFDIADTHFINKYFEILHKPYEKDGVSFWWIDWQQGTNSALEGLDPLWALNHYHYLDNGVNHDVPLILSRFSGVGSHRYPLGFSGDTFITWETLKYLAYFTLTASNIGYTWWSHDIGGHMCGEMNEELYLRHIQFGVFSPINRLHCSNAETTTKEPWVYGNGTGRIAEDWFRLRHKLIPLLYSLSYRTHKDGLALIEPMYYKWADKKPAYDMKYQYLFGENLIVAPVITPVQDDGYSYTEVWLPEGKWTDIFTGDVYVVGEKGEKKTLMRKLESIPVLAKEGTIIPLSMDKGNFARNPSKLEIDVYSGKGEFTLFEDGSEGSKFKGEAFTKFINNFESKDDCEISTLDIETFGASKVIPKNRTLRVVFKNILDGEIVVYENGKKISLKELYLDNATAEFKFNPSKKYKVIVKSKKLSDIEKVLIRAKDVLSRSEGDNDQKFWGSWVKLKDAKSVKEFLDILEISPLRDEVKARIKENM